MSGPGMSGGPVRQSVMLGILRVARGRADGIGCFANTSQAFLASLAPLVAFPLVGAGLGIFVEGPRPALTSFAMTVCALLMPPVISFELARWWKRAEAWPRFATAFNWCEWTLPVLAVLLMLPLSVAIQAGLDEKIASRLVIGLLCAYGLWLHWFLAHKALALSALRAVLLVAIVNAATIAVVMAPRLLAADPG